MTVVLSDDGLRLAIEELEPEGEPRAVLLVVSGVTGVNPEAERPMTERLRGAGCAVLTLEPRGTGRSEGRRGDVRDFERYMRDFDLAAAHARARFPRAPIVLFGHSMGGAFALELAARAPGGFAGVVLVNPAYKYRAAPGMTPRFRDYVRYALCYLFARGRPVVDMGGDPALIRNASDREEAEARRRDGRIVPLQSMRTMIGAKRIMDRSAANAARIDAPLLLVEGALDELIDPQGSREIYEAWKGRDRERFVAQDAGHGRRAVLEAMEAIIDWLERRFTGSP